MDGWMDGCVSVWVGNELVVLLGGGGAGAGRKAAADAPQEKPLALSDVSPEVAAGNVHFGDLLLRVLGGAARGLELLV